MANLYELTGEFLTLMEMLEDEEFDEQTIMDTLEGIDYEIEQKADGYAKIIKSLQADAAALKKESERLNARKTVFENRAKRLKDNLEMCMRAVGKTKFSTELFSFNIQKNGGKRRLVIDSDLEDVPEEFRIKQPDIVNSDLVRDYLKENGETGESGTVFCKFAHLEPQGESLRIR